MALQFARGTPIVVSDAAGDDYHITVRTLAATPAGRQSAQIDLGLNLGPGQPLTYLYEITVRLEFVATPTLGNVVQVYWKQGTDNGTTNMTNDDGTGDAVVSAVDKLKNLLFLGVVTIDEAAADIPTAAVFYAEIFQRYGNIVLWNDAGSAINDVNDTDNVITITPITMSDA